MSKPTRKLFKVAVVTTIVVAIVIAVPFAAFKLVTRKKNKK